MLLNVTSGSRLRAVAVTGLIVSLITAGYLATQHDTKGNTGLPVVDRIVGAPQLPSANAASGELVVQNAAALATQSSALAARKVFNQVNYARQQAHLPPFKWVAGLVLSATSHDLVMASRNALSHQLPREASLGARITARKVAWRSAGENIGWSSSRTDAGALSVHKAMLAERAPNNGHRLNILSRSFNSIGINVLVDNVHHRLWLTEDFARR
jgi:uncharacterized protein YkwD